MSKQWFQATRSSFVVALVAALLYAGEVQGQDQRASLSPMAVGTRVRILAPAAVNGRIEGMILEMDEKSLLLMSEEQRLRVPRESITQLEVSTGKRRRALKGLIVGAGLGTLVYGAMGVGTTVDASHGEAALVGLGVGAAWGVGIGALIKADRWSSVPLERVQFGLAPTRGKGLGLALSVSF